MPDRGRYGRVMPIDVTAARAATPGCQDLIHLNNAGAALPTHDVLTTQIDYCNSRRGSGATRRTRTNRPDRTDPPDDRPLIGADPSGDEVALTVNNTAAFDLFLYSWAISPTPLTLVIASSRPKPSTREFRRLPPPRPAVRHRVEVVPSNDHGELDLDALEASIRRTDVGPVTLIALNHIPTNGGLINPAAGVGAIAREYGITYLLDACQSAGQIPLDVDELGCDALTAAGRKFLRGPRGTGFLYVRSSILPSIEPIMLDHSTAEWLEPDHYEIDPTARRFEQWERNHAHCSASGTPSRRRSTMGSTPSLLEFRVSPRHFVAPHRRRSQATVRDLGRERCGIVTFSLDGADLAAVHAALRDAGINVSIVPPASALIDTRTRDLPPMIRASVHYYNTEAEIDQLITELLRLR